MEITVSIMYLTCSFWVRCFSPVIIPVLITRFSVAHGSLCVLAIIAHHHESKIVRSHYAPSPTPATRGDNPIPTILRVSTILLSLGSLVALTLIIRYYNLSNDDGSGLAPLMIMMPAVGLSLLWSIVF